MTVESPRADLRAGDLRELAPNLAPPPGNPRFPLFDSLRAIAALSVFGAHSVLATYPLRQHPVLFPVAATVSQAGVAIFFLISGFLLYRPFLVARRDGRQITVKSYARRRALRIVPAYWVALTLFTAAGFVTGVTRHNWWIFYGFAQNYSFNTIGQGIGVAWTLCIEVTFYAALPVFALLAKKLGRRPLSLRGDAILLVVLGVGSLVYRFHFGANFAKFWIIYTLPGTFFWFALGMGLAVASVAQEGRAQALLLARFATRYPTVCWSIAVALVAFSYQGFRGQNPGAWASTATFALRGLAALFVLLPGVFGEDEGGYARRILRVRALAWVGLVSYAFYLYHPVVINQVMTVLSNLDLPRSPVAVLALSFAFSCACAAASYYLLERPIMRFRYPFVRLRLRRPPLSGYRAHVEPPPVPADPATMAAEPGCAQTEELAASDGSSATYTDSVPRRP